MNKKISNSMWYDIKNFKSFSDFCLDFIEQNVNKINETGRT